LFIKQRQMLVSALSVNWTAVKEEENNVSRSAIQLSALFSIF